MFYDKSIRLYYKKVGFFVIVTEVLEKIYKIYQLR